MFVTLGFYALYFTNQFIKKINILTRDAFGTEIKELAKRPYLIGWCIILFPFVLVVAAILLNAAFGMPFNLDSTSPLSLLRDSFALITPAVFGITPTMVLIGYTIVWLILVCAMAGYTWNKTFEMRNNILLLAEYHGRCDIKDDYEDALNNMKFYDSKIILTEKLNIEAFNKLITRNFRDFEDF